MAFVYKQTAVLVVRINNIDNNAVLTNLWTFFSLNTLLHTSITMTGCIFNVFSVFNTLTHLTPMLCVGSL